MTDVLGSTEMQMLWLSAALLLVQLVLAVLASIAARGLPWAAGPRDEPGAALTLYGGRLERAYRNMLETFPLFAVLALMTVALNRHSAMSALGAELYFWGRVAYVPLYVLGVPFLRTAAWAVAIAGILRLLLTLWPGI